MKKIVLVKGEPGLYEVAGGVLEVFPVSVYGEATASVYDNEAQELIDDYDFTLVAEVMYANGDPLEWEVEVPEPPVRVPRKKKRAQAQTPDTETAEEDGAEEDDPEGAVTPEAQG